ncbi:FeoB-associated Cys-rich membrane protein [Massilicoli timonensis]|nr:FeoB-associated Cys-rich membrane protein [Massilicoli timonensis]
MATVIVLSLLLLGMIAAITSIRKNKKVRQGCNGSCGCCTSHCRFSK